MCKRGISDGALLLPGSVSVLCSLFLRLRGRGDLAITVRIQEMKTDNAVWGRFLGAEQEKGKGEEGKKKSGVKGTVAAVALRRKTPPRGALARFPPTSPELEPTLGTVIDRLLAATDGGARGGRSKRSLLGFASPITSPAPAPPGTRWKLPPPGPARPRGRWRPLTDEGGRGGRVLSEA